MLRVALKLLVYLSILTSTRTSSTYLESQPLVNFRRSGVSANPQQQQQQKSQIDIEVDQQLNERSYFIPRLVNSNRNMLFTQLSNTQLRNNKRASKKSRKNKKEQQQQFYESHIKRKSSFNDDALPSEDEEQNSFDQIVNHSNTTTTNQTNEYPSAQIDAKHERELQELFGIEGARKYQEYQLKQQMLNQQQTTDAVKDLPQKKRDNSLGAAEEVQDVSGAMINQMMSRTTRRQREYDVPLIQCPPATDGMERFACPTPDRQGRYRCIDDHVLCDGFIDCPEGADEDRQACMFYKTTKAHLDVLADALLRWARGR